MKKLKKGVPGTGKSDLVREFAKKNNMEIVEIRHGESIWDLLKPGEEPEVHEHSREWREIKDIIEDSGLTMGRIFYLKSFMDAARKRCR